MRIRLKCLDSQLLKSPICFFRFIQVKTKMEFPRLLTLKNVGVGVVSVAVCSEVVCRVYNWMREKYRNRKKQITEVLFFPDDAVRTFKDLTYLTTHDFYNLSKVTSGDARYKDSSLLKLLYRLRSAKHTLDLCLYFITCHEFTKVILECQNKGVKVRLIVDESMVGISGSQVGVLRKAGVFVRARKKCFLMHHKFALVDGEILVNGSFNWSGQVRTVIILLFTFLW